MHSRSTVPAMTRPSGKRRGDRRFGQRVGAEQVGKAVVGDHRAGGSRDFLAARWSVDRLPVRASEAPRARRSSGATPGKRSNKAWSKVPRRAAARISGLGGGAASRSSAICDGASGRGGRASRQAPAAGASREARSARAAACRLARGGGPALAAPIPALAPHPSILDRAAPSACIARLDGGVPAVRGDVAAWA